MESQELLGHTPVSYLNLRKIYLQHVIILHIFIKFSFFNYVAMLIHFY